MNNLQQIGAVLTGMAALATASVTVYTTLNEPNKEKINEQQKRSGLIFDQDGWTNLRQLPSSESRIITRLANYTEIFILNHSGNWYQVETKNNVVGFIYKDNFLEK